MKLLLRIAPLGTSQVYVEYLGSVMLCFSYHRENDWAQITAVHFFLQNLRGAGSLSIVTIGLLVIFFWSI